MSSKKNKVSSSKSGKNKKQKKDKKSALTKAIKKSTKSAKPVAKKKVPLKKIVKSKSSVAKKITPVKKLAKKKIIKPLITKVSQKIVPKKVTVKKPIASKKTLVKKVTKVVATKKPLAKQELAVKVKQSIKQTNETSTSNKPIVKKEIVPGKITKVTETVSKKSLVTRPSSDVLAISNTIPIKSANEISLSKIASISNSITNPIKKTDSYAIKPEKEPNGKFELEFVVHASADMLYEFLSTPSGLSEWFCDDLNIRNGIYTFIWEDQLQQARLLKTIEVQLVRFQWVDKTDGSYFEFRIQRDDLTNDISLIITDFADSVSERESAKLLWHSQIEKLMHVIGSIF